MISRSDPRNAYFLAMQEALEQRVAKLQRQITSGHRVENPSDAPESVRDILNWKTSIVRTDQLLSNLQYVKAEVDTGESTLREAVKTLEQIRVLGVQGANGTQNQAGTRTILAAEVAGLQERLVGLANTQVSGRFIFGGDADGAAPYRFDALAAGGVVQLTAAASTRLVEDPAGGTFSASLTAAEIFDAKNPDSTPANGNVFQAVNALRLALLNDDAAAAGAALDNLRTAAEHLNQQLAFYGRTQKKVDASIEFAYRRRTEAATHLSALEDTDLTAAIVELSDAQTQRDVSLQSKAQSRPRSLFDYL